MQALPWCDKGGFDGVQLSAVWASPRAAALAGVSFPLLVADGEHAPA